MNKILYLSSLFFAAFCFFIACEEDTAKVEEFNPTPYELIMPEGLPKPRLPEDNPLTLEGIKLGKKLFFETKLSGDNTQSCGSCHNQQFAFTDNMKALSIGIEGLEGKRNSMPLFNLFYHNNVGFFWDGRAKTLREQSLMPIQDPLEMNETLENVVNKLKKEDDYKQLFFDAFGTSEINTDRISLALEQYMLTLVSGNSKYDRVQAGLEEFTESEKRGFNLFFKERDPFPLIKGSDCFHCHSGPNFTNNEFMNNGLDEVLTDLGLGGVTKNEFDNGKFKVPSLRNIAVSAPYMHDGRFKSLKEVLDHYNGNVKENSPNLDPNMHGAVLGLNLEEEHINDIISFLKTLTDDVYLNNPEYKEN